MEVLSESIVSELGGNGWLIALFITTIFLIIIGTVGLFAAIEEADGALALISLAIIVVFGILSYFVHGWASVERTEYKVVIDDFNEVYEDYEIIDQEGDIYTVIKKDDTKSDEKEDD